MIIILIFILLSWLIYSPNAQNSGALMRPPAFACYVNLLRYARKLQRRVQH